MLADVDSGICFGILEVLKGWIFVVHGIDVLIDEGKVEILGIMAIVQHVKKVLRAPGGQECMSWRSAATPLLIP